MFTVNRAPTSNYRRSRTDTLPAPGLQNAPRNISAPTHARGGSELLASRLPSKSAGSRAQFQKHFQDSRAGLRLQTLPATMMRWKSALASRAPSLRAAANQSLRTMTETGTPTRGNKILATREAARIPGSAPRPAPGIAERRGVNLNVPLRNPRSVTISIPRIADARANPLLPLRRLRSNGADF